jgi:drug/metabolite transporter (DMT)-like permease
MRVLKGLGGGFWAGILLIALGVVVLVTASQAQSCVTDFDVTVCETGGVVILNVIGLVLFVIGAMCITVAAAVARNRSKRLRAMDGQDTT